MARGYHGEQSQHDAPHLAATDAQCLCRPGGAASLLKRGCAQRRQQPRTTYPTVDKAHDTLRAVAAAAVTAYRGLSIPNGLQPVAPAAATVNDGP